MSHPTSQPRRVRRATRGRLLGGVCRGIAEHLHWSVEVVRLIFVILTFAGGFGLVLYAAYWAWLPLDDAADGPDASRPGAPRGRDLAGVLGLAALGLGLLIALSARGIDVAGSWTVPLLLVAVGVGVLWRQSDDSRREALIADVGASARTTTLTAMRLSGPRIALGLALVLLGVFGALASQGDIGASLRALAAARPRARRSRARAAAVRARLVARPRHRTARPHPQSEERAEVAAQVHDSVLQTLTLIQRSAADPDEVVRLARSEERALRKWLYAPVGDPEATLVAALESDVAQVETAYACTVEVVHVGDVPRDDRVESLVAAAREAVVNAAKHAGGAVSVYVECDADRRRGVRPRPRPRVRPARGAR